MTNPCKLAIWYRPAQVADEVMWLRCSGAIEVGTESRLMFYVQDRCRNNVCFLTKWAAQRELKP